MVGAGINARTGQILSGWDHVVQSIEVALTTRYGERVERRWIGSAIPHLLGENLTPETFLRFIASIPQSLAVIELNGLAREPRFDLKRVSRLGMSPETVRLGRAGLLMEGHYLPNGHKGDRTSAGIKRISLGPNGAGFIVRAMQ